MPKQVKDLATRNKHLAYSMGAVVVGMVCLAYASVPIYNLFCKVTGFGGTTQRAFVSADYVGERQLTIRFNADINPKLAWKFLPMQSFVSVKTGENGLAFYTSENLTDQPIKGMAIYNVAPDKAGKYFNKIECFCFQEQTLAAHEKRVMPVMFFIDPALEKDPEMGDVHTITLSYTFFPYKR